MKALDLARAYASDVSGHTDHANTLAELVEVALREGDLDKALSLIGEARRPLSSAQMFFEMTEEKIRAAQAAQVTDRREGREA